MYKSSIVDCSETDSISNSGGIASFTSVKEALQYLSHAATACKRIRLKKEDILLPKFVVF